ncbi:type III PLP-dependent enzyme domain-containing protein [Plantactinospora endophytica]|uniref:Diaminopimelate decarboxylase n=1 Tax=Plantactinospora endophytica TaxID=673535 RepID=A0ABQ4E026_9ACTN|nr:type III PLP-dependent enzyme [Plantactinospora endophytica]GIG88032.1 diaminopimelate decarboxylase [Plantactinospora endophytica]
MSGTTTPDEVRTAQLGWSTAATLVARYGSPLYVYELRAAEEAVTELRRCLPEPSALYYSLKANPHPVLTGALHAEGCRAEISSTGELEAALQAGIPGDRCLYTGPGKSRQEISAALAAGVRRFSVESAADYRKVDREASALGTTAHCLLRVNSQRSHGGSGLRMTGAATQFGVDLAELRRAPAAYAPLPGARIVGLHFFPLSNAEAWQAVADEMVASIEEAARLRAELGIELRVVDLGGGFAAPYAAAGPSPDYSSLRPVLEAALDTHLPGWRSGRPEIAFESGRFLAGRCGRLLCTVEDVKRSGDRTFVVLDGGINQLGGLSGLGRLLPLKAAVRQFAERGAGPTGPDEETVAAQVCQGAATVVGPLCTPADRLAADQMLAGARPGDLVEIPNVGAYGLTASLVGFLGRPAAAEVVLRDGTPCDASRLTLRRDPVVPSVAPASDSSDHMGE